MNQSKENQITINATAYKRLINAKIEFKQYITAPKKKLKFLLSI